MQLNQFKEHIKSYVPFRLTNDQEKLLHVLHDFLSYDIGKKTFVLKGYAGTGKTTMVSALVKALGKWNYTSMLLAPTGRAAKVLTGYSKRRAFTIHKMIYSTRRVSGRMQFVLKNNTFKRTIFIIDEASMIDIFLMVNLLRAIPLKAQVVIIGDIGQLPSVSAGAVLRDIINSKQVACARIEKIQRQKGTSSIIVKSHDIDKGKFDYSET